MTITLKRTVNLSEPVLPEVLSAPIYEGEKNAHTFMITAEKDKLPHALSGSVVAYFERNDGNTVRVEGETKDGAAILTLSPECYQTGVFYLAVMLISDGAQTVIYAASGRVRNTQDGEIIDGGNTIPTYDEIIAHLNKYLSTDITAKVEKTEDGARITMKDVVNGETVALVKNGKSAYEVAVSEGFEGTPEEWLATLKGDNNIFIVHVTTDEDYNYIADKTADEVRAAVEAGKLPIMFENIGDIKDTYLYCGEKTLNTERWPYFRTLPIDGAKGHKTISEAYLKNDKMVEGYSEFPVTAVTENKLTIKYGDQETKFDGSKPETVSIKDDLFVIRIDTSNKSDKTQAEVRAAAAAGKCLVLIDAGSGRTALYAGEFADKNDPSGMRPSFITQMRNDGQDIDYALSYYYLNADGKFTVKTHKPVTTPTPLPLTIKTADGEKAFNGSEPLTIDLTNLGSGGGNDKRIVGVMNGNTAVFSKTAAEIGALGEDVRNYEIILVDGAEIYTESKTYIYDGTGGTFAAFYLVYVNKGEIKQRYVAFKTDGTIRVGAVETTNIPNIPGASGLNKDVMLVANSEQYKWVDVPYNNPVIYVVATGNGLYVPNPLPLPQIVQNILDYGNVALNLLLVELANNGVDFKSSDIYHAIKIGNLNDVANMYAIFANGVGPTLKMDATGNVTYYTD